MILRSFAQTDAARVAELAGDYEVSRWTSNVPHPYSVSDAESWIASTLEGGPRRPFAAEVDGELVACVGFWPDDRGGFEIGYWVGRAYWGQGIATRALTLLLEQEVLPHGKAVSAKIMTENLGSQRVLEKCGFSFFQHCLIERQGESTEAKLFLRDS